VSTKVRKIVRNFTGGEVSDAIVVRDDLVKYESSCSIMENFVPQLHGSARFRSGTYFCEDVGGLARIVPFNFNGDLEDIYVLVFTNLQLRIIQGYGFVKSGGSTVTITTPYTAGYIPNLTFAQRGDTIYIANPHYQPRKLVRTSHTSWTLSTVAFNQVPSAPTISSISFVEGPDSPGASVAVKYCVCTVVDGRLSLPSAEATVIS